MHNGPVDLKFVPRIGSIEVMKPLVSPLAPKRLGILALTFSSLLFSGCTIRDPSLADRCSDMMRRSFPGGGIEVKKTQIVPDEAAPSVASQTVQVEGVRPDVPAEGFLVRDVAAECHFENGIVTSFRWTTGPFR